MWCGRRRSPLSLSSTYVGAVNASCDRRCPRFMGDILLRGTAIIPAPNATPGSEKRKAALVCGLWRLSPKIIALIRRANRPASESHGGGLYAVSRRRASPPNSPFSRLEMRFAALNGQMPPSGRTTSGLHRNSASEPECRWLNAVFLALDRQRPACKDLAGRPPIAPLPAR